MEEGVGVFLPIHQARPLGFPQQGMNGLHRLPEDDSERGGIGGIAQTGEPGQGVLRVWGQAGELAHHQVHHVVRIALGMDARQIPLPCSAARIEAQQLLLGQGAQEQAGEEGIAAGLVQHQLRQRLRLLAGTMQRLGHELSDIVRRQGR